MARDPKDKPAKPKTAERDTTKQQQLIERRKNRGASEQADWGSVDGGLMRSTIASVTRQGFAIQFGYTLEGSAYRIRLVGGGDVKDEYVRPSEDIDAYLRALCLDFEGDC
jgi:hypothetical protein